MFSTNRFLDEPLHFLARGDFFKHKLAARLLSGVHIIPVFRMRDAGYSGIKNNYESFNRSFRVLSNKKTLMILAEGRSIHEKRLRPIRKGTARIALGALDSTSLEEVYIVPIGVNYTYADRIRSDIMINCGEPILASEYLEQYREAPSKTITELTSEVRQRLSDEVVIIDRVEDEPLVENLLRLYRTESGYPPRDGVGGSEEQLRAEKKIADTVNALPDQDRQALASSTHDYFSRLERMRITDEALQGRYKRSQKKTGQVIFGILPALLVVLWLLPPLVFSQWFSGVKMKTLEFGGPVRWASLLVTYVLYSVLWLIVALVFWSWIPLVLVFSSVLAIPWLIRYGETTNRWLLAWRTGRQNEDEIKYVRNLRKRIISEVQGFWKS